MAVNKNFVVKNGIEVNSSLILANADTNKVGIGTTIPGYVLHVNGGIGATDIYISGLSTFVGFSTFQDSIGVQKDIAIAGISTVVGVATFKSDVYVDGNLNVIGDITYDEVIGRNIYISGLSTFVGVSTFQSAVGFRTDVFVSGMSTIVGVATFKNDVYVDGNLNVVGDISYDEVTGRNLDISGIATIATLYAAAGIITASDVHVSAGTTTKDLLVTGVTTAGIVTGATYYGDGSNLTGVSTSFTGSIGIQSGGTVIGTGITMLNIAGGGSTAWATSNVATIQLPTAGVSIGMVIALS